MVLLMLMKHRCSGESINAAREIMKLASIREMQKGMTSSDGKGRDELESLISAKLAQCRVIFDFSCDPLSDLKYKVCIMTSDDEYSPHDVYLFTGSEAGCAA